MGHIKRLDKAKIELEEKTAFEWNASGVLMQCISCRYRIVKIEKVGSSQRDLPFPIKVARDAIGRLYRKALKHIRILFPI